VGPWDPDALVEATAPKRDGYRAPKGNCLYAVKGGPLRVPPRGPGPARRACGLSGPTRRASGPRAEDEQH
jgi:hypothetical protein